MTLRAAACGLALCMAATVATGCGTEGERGGSPATSATTPTVATAEPGEALASYTRSGGLAGRRFSVVVRPDGSFEGGSGRTGRGHLGGSALEELRKLVDAFSTSGPAPTYGTAVPDGFITSVTAGGASTSILGDARPPQAVAQLLGFLAGLERQLPR